MDLTTKRIKMVREALSFKQPDFASIFTSQRKEGKPLTARAISHWENGKAQPTHSQLGELVEFLADPTAWLFGNTGLESEWTALTYLVWFHPDDIQNRDSRLIDPRAVPGRRERIKSLIFDILNLQLPQPAWDKELELMTRHCSPRWSKEVTTAKLLASANLSQELFEQALAKDIKVHGLGLEQLLHLSQVPPPIYEQVKKMHDFFHFSFSQLSINTKPLQKPWDSLSIEELEALRLGIQIVLPLLNEALRDTSPSAIRCIAEWIGISMDEISLYKCAENFTKESREELFDSLPRHPDLSRFSIEEIGKWTFSTEVAETNQRAKLESALKSDPATERAFHKLEDRYQEFRRSLEALKEDPGAQEFLLKFLQFIEQGAN